MRLIDTDALMSKLKFIQEAEHQIYGKESWGFASKCITAIEDAPTIEERPTGEWLTQQFGSWAECSECHELYDIPIAQSNFCPNCGAEMNGEKRND